MFEKLQIEKVIFDSCLLGKNLTMFSLEDRSKKCGLSRLFNGDYKDGSDSLSKPGLIRMTVESIFALIFSNKTNEFVI